MEDVVNTTMNYYLDPCKGGQKHCTFGTVGVLRRKFDNHSIQVQDVRGREDEFDIHTHAFQLGRWRPSTDSLLEGDIKETIYREAEEYVKQVRRSSTNATRVQCFSHLIRQNTYEQTLEDLRRLEAAKGRANVKDTDGISKTIPARYAHVDQSAKGARSLLDKNLPLYEADRLTRTRWGTVNLWRPIRPVVRDPLGFCDGRSLRDEDLVPVDTLPPPKGTSRFYHSVAKGDGFQVYEARYSPRHEWYYCSDMGPDEALVFKVYDTKNSSLSRCCHSAFNVPGTANAPPRESMEMRFFVFYEDEPLEGF
ncbi:hypothetical protein F5Y17DRAFT_474172 [Xylariaceae sp. FL0594]|nr:hypothetical protein F5Y17DRAFT_474172 [Xylariaceae sp. FL0594]